MNNKIFRHIFAYLFLLTLLFSSGHAQGLDKSAGVQNENRVRILSNLIRSHLELNHFERRKIDNRLSEAAFGIYLKKLDSQKNLLLKQDVGELKKHLLSVDDQMNAGHPELPLTAAAVLSARVPVVHGIVKEILSEDFDFSEKEFIETDADKIDFAKTDAELKDRWKKILKYQALQQYIEESERHIASSATRSALPEQKEAEQGPSEKEIRELTRTKLLKTYELYFSRLSAKNEAEYLEDFFNSVTHAFDPHTEYMPPMSKDDFDIRMSGSLEGIGATLKEDENYIKVVSIIAGGPASKHGQLQAEDIILKVAEGAKEPVDIIGMKVKDAVRLIRGKKGTEVRLTIRKPDNKTLDIALVRDVIQIEDTFVKSTIIQNGTGDNFGYIKVPSFYRDFGKTSAGAGNRNSTDDFKAELKGLVDRNISGLIVDLRNNGGGALTDAVKITGFFIETGPVVQVKNSSGSTLTLGDDDPEIVYTGPVVILVNRLSASASEILAGALQDYKRAVVIGGAHTHGKGTVQTIVDFDSDMRRLHTEDYRPIGALKLTTQKFYRISGDSTQYSGVKPDLVLPDFMNGLKTGEQYLDFALPWDSIDPVPFKKWQKCEPDIAELKEKSLTRVKSDRSLMDMEIEAEKIARKQKNTLKSLNLEDFRSEIAESKALRERYPEAPGHPVPGEDTRKAEDTKEAFLKGVSADAYVKEAISVIGDIIVSSPSCVSVTAN
jgi:carboxyl-terminal processing protease